MICFLDLLYPERPITLYSCSLGFIPSINVQNLYSLATRKSFPSAIFLSTPSFSTTETLQLLKSPQASAVMTKVSFILFFFYVSDHKEHNKHGIYDAPSYLLFEYVVKPFYHFYSFNIIKIFCCFFYRHIFFQKKIGHSCDKDLFFLFLKIFVSSNFHRMAYFGKNVDTTFHAFL